MATAQTKPPRGHLNAVPPSERQASSGYLPTYFCHNGRMFKRVYDNKGEEKRVQVINAIVRRVAAYIDEREEVPVGANAQITHVDLEVAQGDTTALVSSIDMDAYASMKWVNDSALHGMPLEFSRTSPGRSDVLNAISMTSPACPLHIAYAHYGWQETGDGWIYLHAGGAVGANGPIADVRVHVSNMEAFSLPPAPNTPEAGRTSWLAVRSIFDAYPAKVAAALIGSWAWQTLTGKPLALGARGHKGSGKTIAGCLWQSFWVPDIEPGKALFHLGVDDASAAFMEEINAAAGYMGVFWDDPPREDSPEKSARSIASLARRAEDGRGKGRGKPKGGTRKVLRHAAATFSTTEGVQLTGSAEDREYTLKWGATEVDLKLAWDLADTGGPARAAATTALVRWAAPAMPFTDEMTDRAKAFRDTLMGGSADPLAPRLARKPAYAATGIEYWLRCAEELGLASKAECDALWDLAWSGICEGYHDQSDIGHGRADHERVLEILEQALRTAECHVVDHGGTAPADYQTWGYTLEGEGGDHERVRAGGRRIGVLSEDRSRVYLVPHTATQLIIRRSADMDDPLNLTEDAIGMALRDNGIAQCETYRRNGEVRHRSHDRRRLLGSRQKSKVWNVPVTAFGLPDDPAENADDPAAPSTPVEPTPPTTSTPDPAAYEPDLDANGRMLREEPQPCVVCGEPTPYRSGGRPCHAMAMCASQRQSARPTPAQTATPKTAPERPQNGSKQARKAPEQTDAPAPTGVFVMAPEGLHRAGQLPQSLPGNVSLPELLTRVAGGPGGESVVVLLGDDVAKRFGLTGQKPKQGNPWHRAFTSVADAGWHAEGASDRRPNVGAWVQLEHHRYGTVRLCVARWLRTEEPFPFTQGELKAGEVPDVGELMERMTRLTSLIGVTYRGTCANTAVTMFREALTETARRTPKWHGSAPIRPADVPLDWRTTRAPSETERGMGHVHHFDLAKAFLFPTKEARLCMDDLRHTGYLVWNPSENLAGFFRISVPEWPWPELPAPTSQTGIAWVTSAVVREYARLGFKVLIHESWSGVGTQPQGSRRFVETVRNALDSLTPDDPITGTLKGLYRTLHGKLEAGTSRIKRSDWGLTIRDEAWVNTCRKAYRTAGITSAEDVPTGPAPLGVDLDELVYASDAADPYEAAKALPGIALPSRGEAPKLGQFKPKRSLAMAEYLTAGEGEK